MQYTSFILILLYFCISQKAEKQHSFTLIADALEASRYVVAPPVPADPVPLHALVHVQAVAPGVGQLVAGGALALVRAGGVDASEERKYQRN